MNVPISPLLLLPALLWQLSGCMQQSVRADNAPGAATQSINTETGPETPVSSVATRVNRPDEPLNLPKYSTTAEVAPQSGTSVPERPEKRVKKVKPTRTAGTVAAAPKEFPASKEELHLSKAGTGPVTDTSGDDRLAMASPASTLPDTAPEEAQTAISRADIMHLDLESLPLSFGTEWSLDRRPNPVTKKTQCILASPAVNIPDGYDTTDVQVLLTLKSIYVSTSSNIDLSYPQTGIRIGAGVLRPFDKLAGETTAVVSGDDVATLYARMTRSPDLVVRLGFWPTWPVTETSEASYSLEDFQTAVMALRACNRM